MPGGVPRRILSSKCRRGPGSRAHGCTELAGKLSATGSSFRYFAMIAGLNVPTKESGDRGMGGVDVLREKAEEYLEKARAVSDRQRARLLLVQAHNHLKCAEETEAQQLSARR
jgi:hypothetical protein